MAPDLLPVHTAPLHLVLVLLLLLIFNSALMHPASVSFSNRTGVSDPGYN